MGMHHPCCHLHGHQSGSGMVAAALSCAAEARARVPQRNSSSSDGLSVVADYSRFCCRFIVAKAGAAILLVQVYLCWTGLSAQLSCGSVAVRQFPYVTGLAKLGLWDCLFCLWRSGGIFIRSL